MKIKKMTATFGALEQAVLTPGSGLTVITAPNEAGKSTWAGFLRAMLYGIDTRERDKAGFLADKNRFQPWSGAPMAGELQVEWQGREVTLRRFASKSGPFSGFEAVYTATGDSVPGLTAANAGELLTGAGREVYLRSAFIGQNGMAVGPSGELEARITALATSGQEDVSYSAVERTLKDWRNRRRANRANGQIPELEQELARLDQALQNTRQTQAQISASREQIARLEEQQLQLQGQLDRWKLAERQELDRRYRQALDAVGQAQARLDGLAPPEPDMAGWTAQQARDWAEEGERRSRQAEEERERLLTQREQFRQREAVKSRLTLALTLALAVIAVIIGILGGLELTRLDPDIILYLLLAACFVFLCRSRLTQNARRKLDAMEVPEAPVPAPWREQAQRHTDYLAQRERLELELTHARQRADDLAAQGGQADSAPDAAPLPAQSRQELAARLGAAEQELARCRGDLARAEGALAQLGDPAELEGQRSRLEGQLRARLTEYDALTAAMEALSAANDALRERFSPALNQAAGEIFSRLTGGRYPKVSLSRDFSAQAAEEDSLLPRSSLALSAGTADQLYLAVRLAICRLTLPDVPILLDDALTSFDDGRMALALDCLNELGRTRQILLFSCQRREGEWARAHGVASLSLT